LLTIYLFHVKLIHGVGMMGSVSAIYSRTREIVYLDIVSVPHLHITGRG